MVSEKQGMRARGQERRAYPRASADVPAQVVLTDGPEPITVKTVNLSGSGACFALPRPIPTGTCLLISLIIPAENEGHIENHFLDFEGVVVRNERPEMEGNGGQYHVAVHFTGAEEEAQKLIDSYVRQQVRKKST